MQRPITRGAAAGAGLIFHVFAQDSASTTGAGKASVAFGSWSCRYIRNGEAISGAITPEDITTIGTYAAPTANTNVRIKAVDNTNMIGVYEIQIHADWVNATNSCQSLTIYLTATGVAVLPIQVPLTGFDLQSASTPQTGDSFARLGAPAGASIAADLAAIEAQTDDIGVAGAGLTALGDTRLANLDAAITTRLAPTTAGRTLDVTAAGNAGIDWANVENPTTALNLSATNIDVDQVVASVSGAVGSVTGAVGSVTGNVGGNVAGSVASVTAGVTLAASAVQAIWDALTSALTTAGSIGKLLVDNINATISSRLASASYTTPPTAAAIADQVWEEAIADHSGTAGSTAEALSAAGSAGDPWSTALPGAYGAGTAGKIVGDNLNATVSSRATQTTADAIEADTQDLQSRTPAALVSGRMDSHMGSAADAVLTAAKFASGAFDAVWSVTTRELTAFSSSFKTGYALSSAGVQAVWDALTSALTTAGSVGKLLVDNINATISSRLASASYTAPLDAAGTRSAVGLASANLDTQLDALPTAAEIATAVGAPSAATIADAVWDEDATGHQTQGTFGQAIGDPGADTDTIFGLVNTNLDAAVSTRLAGGSYTAPPTVVAIRQEMDANSTKLDVATSTRAAAGDAMALTSGERDSIADALLDRTAGVETNRTPRQALRLMLAAMAGKLSGAATATVAIRDTNDSKDRITATVDGSGNRTAVTLDAS